MMDKDKLIKWLETERFSAMNEDISWAYSQVIRAVESNEFDTCEHDVHK